MTDKQILMLEDKVMLHVATDYEVAVYFSLSRGYRILQEDQVKEARDMAELLNWKLQVMYDNKILVYMYPSDVPRDYKAHIN